MAINGTFIVGIPNLLMYKRRYVIPIAPTAITTARDLVEILCFDDMGLRVLSLSLGQESDAGESQEELLGVLWSRGGTQGSGGGTVTPIVFGPSGPAAGFQARTWNTTQGSTVDVLARHIWNTRMPFERQYPDEIIETATVGNALVLRTIAAPADSITVSGSVLVEEFH